MKIRKLTTIVLAGVLAIVLASPVFAQATTRMGGGPGMMMGGGPQAMGAQLTPQQQQTLQNIEAGHRDAFLNLHKKLWAKRIQLAAALTEDKIDQGKVNSLVSDINKLRSSLFEEQVKMRVEIAKAGLAYYAMGGHMTPGGMMGRGMGPGMMGRGMMGPCPMMDADDPDE